MKDGVLILTNSFPELSETFIRDHILALTEYSDYDIFIGAKVLKMNNPLIEKSFDKEIISQLLDLTKTYNPGKLFLIRHLILDFYKINLSFKRSRLRRAIISNAFNNFLRENRIKNIHIHFGNVARELFYKLDIDDSVKIHVTFHGYDIRLLTSNPNYYSSIVGKVKTAFAISDWNFQALQKAGFSENLIMLGNPINTGFFSKKESIKLSDANNIVSVLSVGRLHHIKGFDKAIEVLKEVRKTNPDLIYQIVGGGVEYERLSKLIDFNHARGYIRLLGYKTKEEIKKIMHNSSILFISSRAEALPTVMLEAMSLEKPIVSSPVGGVAEYLKENNFLSEDHSVKSLVKSLDDALSNQRKWSDIGCANRSLIIEKHSYQKFCKKLINRYNLND